VFIVKDVNSMMVRLGKKSRLISQCLELLFKVVWIMSQNQWTKLEKKLNVSKIES
jgi:hypothetical protein